VIGDAGNAEGHASSYFPIPEWSAFRNGTQYGHGEIMVFNASHLEWTWHRNVDGEILESDSVLVCNSWALGTSIC
jgi:hypothetical protein